MSGRNIVDVVVLICDGKEDIQGDIIGPDTVITMNSSLDVYSSFDRGANTYLGVAHVKLVDNKVLASFCFHDEYKFRQGMNQFPAVAGRVLYRDGKNVKNIQIDSIALVSRPNADPRIMRLGTNMVLFTRRVEHA